MGKIQSEPVRTAQRAGTRTAKWENTKFFLIICVVIGHAITSFTKQSGPSRICQSLFCFIYTYHIPSFIFLSGLVQRPFTETELKPKRILCFLRIAVLANILNFLAYSLCGREMQFHLFTGVGVAWYMFALAAFTVLTWLAKDLSRWYLLGLSLCAALVGGYDNDITLLFSQILCFYPYYVAGYALEPEKVMNFLEKKWVKILSAIFLAVLLALCVGKLDVVYPFRPMLAATTPYEKLSRLENANFLHRILVYALQTASSLAVMSLVPQKRIPYVTQWGGRTLQVYLFHRSILFVLLFLGVPQRLQSCFGSPAWLILWMLWAVVLTCLLSTRWVQSVFKKVTGQR